MTKQLSSDTGLSRSDADRIVRALVKLYSMHIDTGIPPNDLIDSLTTYLEEKPPKEWRDANLVQWRNARAAISRIVASIKDDSPLATCAKAIRQDDELAGRFSVAMRLLNGSVEIGPMFTVDSRLCAERAFPCLAFSLKLPTITGSLKSPIILTSTTIC